MAGVGIEIKSFYEVPVYNVCAAEAKTSYGLGNLRSACERRSTS
ncbi:hypothetical protein THF1C08_260008 [Vibrio jasicida]|jgi:hypothetical protein|uniref:Uncharacterized protein n=1 Tax=Vibrio jasicida TaxID=766224 RepID=A0AAU9QVK9_9VIBR|nr:hypothetical protein THF1C08_260008 [Vibrio jasicida]CAH1602981.1 hypothetical protein THF1A12_610008 [Vibrio jasicida]